MVERKKEEGKGEGRREVGRGVEWWRGEGDNARRRIEEHPPTHHRLPRCKTPHISGGAEFNMKKSKNKKVCIYLYYNTFPIISKSYYNIFVTIILTELK